MNTFCTHEKHSFFNINYRVSFQIGEVSMKQMSHHKIISLIIISSLVIVISLLCLTITKSIISSNILSESPTRYTEKLRFLGHSQIVSEKCEIIITFDDKNYINQLKLNYSNCKIIKNQSFIHLI